MSHYIKANKYNYDLRINEDTKKLVSVFLLSLNFNFIISKECNFREGEEGIIKEGLCNDPPVLVIDKFKYLNLTV